MEKIIDIIKGITFDDILRGLKHWYTFAILFCILSIIVLLILTCVLFKPDALKKQAKNTENSITFVSIYYEDKRIFTINDHNPKIPYKEYIDTFLGHFTKDKDDKRVALWLNELEKENHTVPHHLEVHTISKKQPIYTILNVTFINYEKKIIHLEMRKFPNIKKIKKRKNSKIYVKHNNEMAELVSNNLHKPITLYLLRITTKNSKDVVESRLDHMTMTYAISRLTKYLSPTRYMCLLKTNEIVVVDLKMIPKNEAIALGHNLYSDMSKNIALTAFRQQYNYKVSIVQEKCNDLSFIELTKLAREVALYADKKSLSDDVIVYDPNISYQKENQTQILQDIEDSIANQSFSCRYTPILNSKDGTIVGYDSELFSLKSIVGSIHDMQDYAYNHQIIDELNKALYLELYQPYSINEALQNSKQFLTMDLNISIYQSYIRMVHSVTTPKNIKTLFIIKDTSLIHLDSTEVTNILNVLHENEMITALELTSTSLFLNAGIYRSFNYFVLRSESFTNLIVSQNLPLFADMISRINIASRNAKIFALGIEKWSIIDILARMNITYISSAEFNVGEKKLPVIDARRQARLIQIRQK